MDKTELRTKALELTLNNGSYPNIDAALDAAEKIYSFLIKDGVDEDGGWSHQHKVKWD